MVVGHVEWIDFLRVDHVPTPGEIVHATEWWSEPGGGGAAAAVQLSKLALGASFFTALGGDELGHRTYRELSRLGPTVHAASRAVPTRRGITHVDASGERTITVVGERLGPRGRDNLPWEELEGADGVYFTAGDAGALRHARKARVLVATSRALDTLVEAQVPLDAIVGSSVDPGESYTPGTLTPEPKLIVATDGERGGTFRVAGGEPQGYAAVMAPGPIADRYGAGDSFAAGLTYGLATTGDPVAALSIAARCGAAVVTGRGPYTAQLRAADVLGPGP